MFLYFFDIFLTAISAALSFCCFLFSGTLIISTNCSSFSIAFLLKLLIPSFCSFLNLSKSNTLFAASSMISPLKMSSSSSSSYAIVSRSYSFTKNVFFVFFKFLYFFEIFLPVIAALFLLLFASCLSFFNALFAAITILSRCNKSS